MRFHNTFLVAVIGTGIFSSVAPAADEEFWPCEKHVRTVVTARDFELRLMPYRTYGNVALEKNLDFSSSILKQEITPGVAKLGVKLNPNTDELFDVTPLKFAVTVKSKLDGAEKTTPFQIEAEFQKSQSIVLGGHPVACVIKRVKNLSDPFDR